MAFAAENSGSMPTNYAFSLYCEGDYFRAISEFKALRYLSANPGERAKYDLYIGLSYLASGKHSLATRSLASCISYKDFYGKALAHNALGANFILQNSRAQAKSEFQKAAEYDSIPTSFFLAWYYFEVHDYTTSREYIEKYKQYDADLTQTFNTAVDSMLHMQSKSAFLAASLSAILPGAGQVYANHAADGLQAFAVNAVALYATYSVYDNEQLRHKPYVGSVILGTTTLMLYIANIWGATRSAQYRNARLASDIAQPVRNAMIRKVTACEEVVETTKSAQ